MYSDGVSGSIRISEVLLYSLYSSKLGPLSARVLHVIIRYSVM